MVSTCTNTASKGASGSNTPGDGAGTGPATAANRATVPQCQPQRLGKALLHGQLFLQNPSSVVLSPCNNKPPWPAGQGEPDSRSGLTRSPLKGLPAPRVPCRSYNLLHGKEPKQTGSQRASRQQQHWGEQVQLPHAHRNHSKPEPGHRATCRRCRCTPAPWHECRAKGRAAERGWPSSSLTGILELSHVTNARLELIPPKY